MEELRALMGKVKELESSAQVEEVEEKEECEEKEEKDWTPSPHDQTIPTPKPEETPPLTKALNDIQLQIAAERARTLPNADRLMELMARQVAIQTKLLTWPGQ